jgi:MFS family permease
MEEGFMLTFPQRVLRGELPNRDFLHLYGPGSVWVLAGFFKVFGDALATERIVGLLQQMGLVFGVFMLARHWGRTIATSAAVITLLVILPPVGLTALGWVGAVALGVWALWAALEARRAEDPRRARRFALASGLLAGLTLLYRPDLIVAMAAGLLAALWGVHRASWRRPFIIGAAVGLSPYLVHVATVGVSTAFRGIVLDPLVFLRGGRRLPIPPRPGGHLAGALERLREYLSPASWPVPHFSAAAQLTVWFFLLLLAVAMLVLVGLCLIRRNANSFRARALFAVGLFTVGMVPQGVQRTDAAHFAWSSCVALGFLVVAAFEILRRARPRLSLRSCQLVAGLGVVVVLVGLVPFHIGQSYVDYVQQTFGKHRNTERIHYNGRTFYAGHAEALEELLPAIDRVSRPGDRLLVGTQDLRKTPYIEAFIYYFLPHLRPGTYYIEMDPGVANAKDSRLAHDVATSDVIVLSSQWNQWSEPNDSRNFGPDTPNRILRERFCLVGRYRDTYELYRRCTPRRQ